MSLIEDILYILHSVLEYFGVPQDVLVPVWDSQLCGQYRSIVRMIGTNLPLSPTPRVHLQIPLHTYTPLGHVDTTMDATTTPSFADVMWVAEDKGSSFAKIRNQLPPRNYHAVRQVPDLSQVQRGGLLPGWKTDPDALRKITALEEELLKLRAQIAMIVTAGPASGLACSQNALGTLPLPPSLPPLTSAPHCTPHLPPAPPPPPPCPSLSAEPVSALELIHQRRKKGTPCVRGQNGQHKLQDSALTKDSQFKEIPSMLDVLKDLNKVKLRSVKRSPGGRPVSRRRSKGTPSFNDPAALIAEALKKKFAHNYHNNSFEKENSVEPSPFSSPESPQITQHTRRSKGRLML